MVLPTLKGETRRSLTSELEVIPEEQSETAAEEEDDSLFAGAAETETADFCFTPRCISWVTGWVTVCSLTSSLEISAPSR